MTRIVVFMLLALTFCALSLVDAQQSARAKFIALDRAQAEQRQLTVEWSRLQYEQGRLVKNARITDVARNTLGMVLPSPNETLYLPLSSGSAINKEVNL
ncbi:MAG: cell division protein FtsL [Ottowia sp.]|jgi:cell division protein FtsL|nr:cell division protein FtsL [Ottowia sp.]